MAARYFVIVSQGGARRRACRWDGICCPLQGKKTFYDDVDGTNWYGLKLSSDLASVEATTGQLLAITTVFFKALH